MISSWQSYRVSPEPRPEEKVLAIMGILLKDTIVERRKESMQFDVIFTLSHLVQS